MREERFFFLGIRLPVLASDGGAECKRGVSAAARRGVDREVAWLFPPYCSNVTLTSLEQVEVPASHTRYV